MKTQTCYRLTRGHNGVPDSAPRHLHWHSLDNALRDIAAWAEERLSAGNLFGGVACVGDDDDFYSRRTYEIRPLTWEITTNLREVNPDDDKQQCATVIVKVYVERRFYKTVRKPLTAVVDGVKLEGYGPEERVYTSDWTTAWLPPTSSWSPKRDGDRAYLTAWIPVSQHTLEWGDEP